ncbi:MAG: VOC family protein [Candidatus Latescibacterota bacterium]|nr:VOC family protein [Candidatus Latescibacterota bacterium]
MSVRQCHHHGFTVSSVETSLQFYCDALGLEVVRVSERRNLPSYDRMLGFDDVALTIGILQHPQTGFILELVQYDNPQGEKRSTQNTWVGASHLAFEVDDVDALHESLTTAGYSCINPPTDVERDGVVVARGFYALDPDGISVELFREFADVTSR